MQKKKDKHDAEILQHMKEKSVVQADPIKDTYVMAENINNRRGDEFREVQPQYCDETRPRRLELPLFSYFLVIIHMDGLTEQIAIFITMELMTRINWRLLLFALRVEP